MAIVLLWQYYIDMLLPPLLPPDNNGVNTAGSKYIYIQVGLNIIK